MAENILTKIVATKKAEVAAAKKQMAEAEVRKLAEAYSKKRPDHVPAKRPFADNLRQAHKTDATGIIAEIKRASPSKGIIRADLDAGTQARKYEQGGAVAISVLTDRDYFRGSIDDLKQARKSACLPVLRKDFLVDPYQFYEAAVIGADAVLLIVRLLSPEQLTDYLQLCAELALDPLVEIHDDADLEVATKAGAQLIGINNRDLSTFNTDISVATRLVEKLQPDQIPIAASGISSRDDIVRTRQAGIRNFLIGESLARAEDTVGFLRELVSGHRGGQK